LTAGRRVHAVHAVAVGLASAAAMRR
jgi:hypothetical protein